MINVGFGAACSFPPLPDIVDGGNADASEDAQPIDAAGPLVTNGQAADLVLGQVGFGTMDARGCSPNSIYPYGLASDGTRIWAGDVRNRVLIWSPLPSGNDTPATGVLGQTSTTTCTTPSSTTGSNLGPMNVFPAFAPGMLVVSDAQRNRIVGWSPTPIVNGQAASFVVGQPSLTGEASGSGSGQLSFPSRVWTDGTRFAVADAFNNRVLLWRTFPGPTTPADVVLGQPGFGPDVGGPISASNMRFPSGVFFDGSRLYVADRLHNRVMIWNEFPTTNNQPADVVLGQPTVVASDGATSQTGMEEPLDVVVAHGALFVADYSNDRVLVFDPVPTTTGAAATYVLGQPDFVTGGGAVTPPTQTTLGGPASVLVVDDELYVSDQDHNRIMRIHLNVP